MVAPSRVKSILAVIALALAAPLQADEPPSPRDLLKSVRVAQSAQNWKLTGRIRTGNRKRPFRLIIENGMIRYEFLESGDTITLRLGEKSSTLEETKGGKTGRITAAKFDALVLDTPISYEDLALRFLYWTDATVIGGEMIAAHSCWKVQVRPPARKDSQYSSVTLWIGKDDGALMKAESYDDAGKWARRFTVTSVMKREGYWLLRQMRIENAARAGGSNPTYLEIEDAEK